MLKKAKVEIWGEDLICQVCKNNKWYPSTVRMDIGELYQYQDFEEQVRYLFECTQCGNSMLFGMLNDWEKDEKNIRVSFIDDVR